MNAIDYPFMRQAGRILNSGQAHSLVLTGNVYDLFHDDARDDYVTLVDYVGSKWNLPDVVLLVYELNGPIRFAREAEVPVLRDAWVKWRTGLDTNELAIKRMLSVGKKDPGDPTSEAFDGNLLSAVGNPTLALEFLRQLCLCSRSKLNGKPLLEKHLIVVIEAADLVIPEGEITTMSDVDRHRVCICQDWFSDPGFMNGADSVVLLAESRSMLSRRVARLPQVLEVAIPSPGEDGRKHFISWFEGKRCNGAALKLWDSKDTLARLTAGLSIQAMAQMLKGAFHENREITELDVVGKVEEFIQAQLGEDIVEFKKPSHRLNDVVGYERLKTFLREDLVPRLTSDGDDALPGAAVCGPIGGGKTYIFEALAAELDIVVLVLKNIRSQWYGQTDVIFERLRRVLEALSKVLIFVDEADTQFGGVGPDAHETERRLTGKIQAMMSDTRLKGHVIWLLMTARIHLLSPDIRRPGRTGDLIIPVLDPQPEDRAAFFKWALSPVLGRDLTDAERPAFDAATKDYAAANFASLRSELKARAARKGGKLAIDEIMAVVHDLLPPAINQTRRYQTLQALINCTRKSLLPNPGTTEAERQAWAQEISKLEAQGIR
jgi:SpoVK/Ycf46/Vps4 family AAA+-type ATPase